MINFSYISALINHRCRVIERYFNPILGDSGCNLLEPGIGFFMFMELTQELVKSLFNYHKDGYLIRKKSISYNAEINCRAGNLSKSINRYVVSIMGNRYLVSRIIFLWHNGYLPQIVDHENRNKLDDKIGNLRAASRGENNKNCSSCKGSTSKYLGVSLFKRDMSWHAQISINYKQTHLGYFKTQELAALAYNRAAVMHHKEFANLNIIMPCQL